MKRLIGLCLNAVLAAGLIGLICHAPAARAADDTARFFGQWKTVFSYNGQLATMISVHDTNGYKNFFLTPTGYALAGSGAFSAASGIWVADAAPPNNGGTYRFVDDNTVICGNALGQTVTWKRDSTSLTQLGARAPAPQLSGDISNSGTSKKQLRGFVEEAPADHGDVGPGNKTPSGHRPA